MREAAKVVSVILHPLVMPTLGALCYFSLFPTIAQFPEPDIYWRIMVALVSLTLVLPLLCVLIMMRVGKVSTMFIEDQRERNWPLALTAIIYGGAAYLLRTRMVPAFLQLFILGAIAAMIIAMLVNLRWKISLHMIGIGGLCGGLTILYYYTQEGDPLYLALAFLLAGVLGTARLLLNAHTPLQILAGFVLGFGTELGLGLALGG